MFADAGTGPLFTANTRDGALDGVDALTAFGIDSTTDTGTLAPGHSSSFCIASNGLFDNFAQSSNTLVTRGFLTGKIDHSNVYFAMSIQTPGLDWTISELLQFGSNVQDPSMGGEDIISGIDSRIVPEIQMRLVIFL